MTIARNGIVSCPHALASEAGVEILKAGGSAVDAAIAASAVLSVIYPHMTSVGGDQFWLIWDAERRVVRFLNSGGRAAASGTLHWFRRRGLGEIPFRGVVPLPSRPGAVAGWCEAHAALGGPACERSRAGHHYARDGLPSPSGWRVDRGDAAVLAASAEAAAIFLPGGTPPRAGQRLRNPDLALTLERIGALGRAGFYEGETAREMARFSREHGGLFTERDLAEQRARWGEPASTTYRGVTVYETPPPTQGLSVLQMLNLLEPYDLSRLDPLGPDLVHLLVQAKQIAFHDRDRLIADPEFVKVPVARLVSKVYAG
jgi:gamma-glutamyltranspeptidase/glutathione hydrolase